MDPKVERDVLIAQYQALTQYDSERFGVSIPLSKEELEKMPLADLKQIVRALSDLSRTPPAGR